MIRKHMRDEKMVSRAGKDLLRNTIRSTDYHNRLLEEEEMWRHWEMERGLTMMVTDDQMKKRMRMDHYPEPSKDNTSQKASYIYKQEARRESQRHKHYWTRKLIEAEEKDPQRWGHSGYRELYPEEFDKNRSLKRERSQSCSSRSSDSSSSSRTSHNKGGRKRKKSKKRKKKKSKEKSKHVSDSDTEELRREIRTLQKEKRVQNKSRSLESVRGNSGVSSKHEQRSRPDRETRVDSSSAKRTSEAAQQQQHSSKHGHSQAADRTSVERKTVYPSTKQKRSPRNSIDTSRSSSRNGSSVQDGSDGGARQIRTTPKPSSANKRRRSISSSGASHSSSGSRRDDDDDASGASSDSKSSNSQRRSSDRSSSSSDSESSGNEQLLRKQMEQVARFRRHFRSHSLEKEPLWAAAAAAAAAAPPPPPAAIEEMHYNSEESDRNYPLRESPLPLWYPPPFKRPKYMSPERELYTANGNYSPPPNWSEGQERFQANSRSGFRAAGANGPGRGRRRNRRRTRRRRKRRRRGRRFGGDRQGNNQSTSHGHVQS